MGDVGQLRPPEWRETSQMFELLRSRAGGAAGLEEQVPRIGPADLRTCGPVDLLSIRNGLLFNHLLL